MIKRGLLKSTDVETAVKILRRGGVVIFPTDTVYGIGCRYDMPQAVARIRNIKKSRQNFPILISNISQAHRLAVMTPVALHLANLYWPGALTIILPSRHPSASPQNDSSKVGFRMPDSDLIRFLIEKVGTPIIGTSANFHGQKPVASFGKLDPNFVKLADLTIEDKCKLGKESTVVDATHTPPKVIRMGAVRIR